MALADTRWRRVRRFIGPVTRRVPGGHVLTESVVYARRALPVRRPEHRFVIFAQGRSGSTLLTDLLNSHPAVHCEDEILTWPRRWPVRYAEGCSVGHRRPVYGFKVKIYQLTDAQRIDPGDFLRDMHRGGWSVIHLDRKNIVRQALSSAVAAERGMYHQRAGAPPPGPVRVDAVDLARRVRDRDAYRAAEACALEGVPHLALEYERDLLRARAHQATADRAFAHLGLDTVPVSTILQKIADRPLSDLVENVDEVTSVLTEEGYGELLARD